MKPCDNCGLPLSGSEEWDIERGEAKFCRACERNETDKQAPLNLKGGEGGI